MKNLLIYSAWLASLSSMFGSLYFSEVLHFEPCTLCWYQRILMYPMVIIFFIGMYFKDRAFPRYILGLAIPGTFIALYQYLLQVGVIKVSAVCTFGETCSYRFINWFGFVTIPFLSFLAFLFISVSMLWVLIKKL